MEATVFLNFSYAKRAIQPELEEINRKKWDEELFDECLQKAEGNKLKAKAMYQHRCSKEQSASSDELDQARKMAHASPTTHSISSGNHWGTSFGIRVSRIPFGLVVSSTIEI